MKYKRTLQLFAIFLACELYAMLFAALVYSCGRELPAAEPAPELTPPGMSHEATSGTKRMM